MNPAEIVSVIFLLLVMALCAFFVMLCAYLHWRDLAGKYLEAARSERSRRIDAEEVAICWQRRAETIGADRNIITVDWEDIYDRPHPYRKSDDGDSWPSLIV